MSNKKLLSAGEDDELVELYDFLYRDLERIGSYYAQLFGGRLSQIEKTEASHKSTGGKAEGSIPAFASAGMEHSKSASSELRKTHDPHDMIVTDVIGSFFDQGRMYDDPLAAPHGSIVVAKGTLVFVDRSLMDLAIAAYEITSEITKKAAPGRRPIYTEDERNTQIGASLIKDFVGKSGLPSAFILKTGSSTTIVGTVKEAGMQEPISTYYFKHGVSGLSDVYVIGIKEQSVPDAMIPGSIITNASTHVINKMAEMLFPADALRVTPIALFRKF